VKLTAVREHYARIAKQVASDDVTVVDSLPDSITPPAVLVAWSDPWLVPGTFCAFTAQLELMVVAQRIEPGGQYEVIETLVSDLLTALKSNGASVRDVTSPFPLQLGGVDYLSASINLIHEVEE
jgi:hypothetical protein